MTPGTATLLDTMLTELNSLQDKPEEQKEMVAKINELLAAENSPEDNLISLAINNALNRD